MMWKMFQVLAGITLWGLAGLNVYAAVAGVAGPPMNAVAAGACLFSGTYVLMEARRG